MKTHYRRISKTALAKIRNLGESGAVLVGEESAGWRLLHVNGEDSDDLPGKFVSASFGGLKGLARQAVHRAKVRETIDGETRIRIIPENKVTEDFIPLPEEGEQVEEGDAVLAVGINPHRFI